MRCEGNERTGDDDEEEDEEEKDDHEDADPVDDDDDDDAEDEKDEDEEDHDAGEGTSACVAWYCAILNRHSTRRAAVRGRRTYSNNACSSMSTITGW